MPDMSADDTELAARLSALERRLDALAQRSDELARLAGRLALSDAPRLLEIRRSEDYERAYDPNPLVSVRIGVYQPGDELFERALTSVRAQSYPNWEAVIVSDGPDPVVARRIAELSDERIRFVERPRRSVHPDDRESAWYVAGVHPFNDALAHARGDWIAPIDQDDEWTPDHLEVLLDTAVRGRAELVYGVCEVRVGEDGLTYFGSWPPVRGDFGFQATIYHAAIARQILYDHYAFAAGEPADWHLARRLLDAGVRFEFVEKVLARYYVERSSLSFGWWRERLRERGRFQADR
jgi:glycosyltransferase involved in cell wall biosynthesis